MEKVAEYSGLGDQEREEGRVEKVVQESSKEFDHTDRCTDTFSSDCDLYTNEYDNYWDDYSNQHYLDDYYSLLLVCLVGITIKSLLTPSVTIMVPYYTPVFY